MVGRFEQVLMIMKSITNWCEQQSGREKISFEHFPLSSATPVGFFFFFQVSAILYMFFFVFLFIYFDIDFAFLLKCFFLYFLFLSCILCSYIFIACMLPNLPFPPFTSRQTKNNFPSSHFSFAMLARFTIFLSTLTYLHNSWSVTNLFLNAHSVTTGYWLFSFPFCCMSFIPPNSHLTQPHRPLFAKKTKNSALGQMFPIAFLFHF